MEIKIQNAKLVKKESLTLTYVKTEVDKSKTKVSEEHKTLVHPDLKSAFAALNIHLAIIAGFVDAADIENINTVDASLSENFHVSGYSIGGDEDDPGIVLTGQKILKNGKALIMNTPFTRFNEKEETGYKFMDDLESKISVIESEVRKYLNEGKKADDPQGSLNFDEPVTSAQVLTPESQQDRDEEILNRMKGKDMVSSYANPEAMDRVKNWDDPEKVIDNTVNDMVKEQRENLRGNGKGSKKKRTTSKA